MTRMLLELMIVSFRIAEDIGLLKRKYAEEGGNVSRIDAKDWQPAGVPMNKGEQAANKTDP